MLRKRFDSEFKRHAVELTKYSDKSLREIADELGVNQKTLHHWVAKSRTDEKGEIVTESDITRLKKELANTREERDILKKAIAIFSKQPNRNMGLF